MLERDPKAPPLPLEDFEATGTPLREEELDSASVLVKASCSSSSFGGIFRAMLRLDPGRRWRIG